jgi:hypothetical protein
VVVHNCIDHLIVAGKWRGNYSACLEFLHLLINLYFEELHRLITNTFTNREGNNFVQARIEIASIGWKFQVMIDKYNLEKINVAYEN